MLVAYKGQLVDVPSGKEAEFFQSPDEYIIFASAPKPEDLPPPPQEWLTSQSHHTPGSSSSTAHQPLFVPPQQLALMQQVEGAEERRQRLQTYEEFKKTFAKVWKASEVAPATLKMRNGWKQVGGSTDDLLAHVHGLGSIWISTSKDISGAQIFAGNNSLKYIYEIQGPLSGIDVNRYLENYHYTEYEERQALVEAAISDAIPFSRVKSVYVLDRGDWVQMSLP